MNILHYFRGITKFTVKSKKTMLLVSSLRNSIPVRSLSPPVEDTVEISTFYDMRKKARRAVIENGGEIIGESSYGILYTFSKYKKRVGLYVSGVLMLLFILISQLFVWEVRVEGNENVKSGDIIKTLNEIGFGEGSYKKGVDLDSLVNNFLIKEKRISWIAVNFDGSVAHVEVREGKNPPLESKKQNVNLIASHDGIILRADVLEGGRLVEKGDVVHKGQLLVSAFIDRNEKSTLRGARGSIWANTEREICVMVPLKEAGKSFTGKNKKSFTLDVLGRKLRIGSFFRSFRYAVRESKNIKAAMSDSIRLPFEITVDTYSEYEKQFTSRTVEEASALARNKADSMLKSISPTFTVASKEEKIDVQGETLIYNCRYSGVENIARSLEFELSE